MRAQVLVAGGVLVMGAGLAVWAQGPPPGRYGPGAHRFRMKEELGLSDTQMDQLHKLRSEERKLAIRRQADTRVARMELRDLMSASTVDEAAVGAKVKQISDLQAATLKARVSTRLAFLKTLTPDQREKLKGLRDQRPRPRRPDRPRPARHRAFNMTEPDEDEVARSEALTEAAPR